MQIAQRRFHDDGRLILQRTHDVNPALERVKQLKDAGKEDFGDSKMIAEVPTWLVGEWLKEAGIGWDDPAMDDVIHKKLTSGEFSALRVWEGTY